MSKYKKINRGGILFVAIAVILALMITLEVVNANIAEKKILEVTEKYFTLEAKYAVLPENVRGNGTETSVFVNHYKWAERELEPMLYTKSAAGKNYVVEKALESFKCAGIYQEKNRTHYNNVEIRIEKRYSNINISNDGKEATAQICTDIYTDGDIMTTHCLCTFTYIKDGSEWYILNAKSAFSAFSGSFISDYHEDEDIYFYE